MHKCLTTKTLLTTKNIYICSKNSSVYSSIKYRLLHPKKYSVHSPILQRQLVHQLFQCFDFIYETNHFKSITIQRKDQILFWPYQCNNYYGLHVNIWKNHTNLLFSFFNADNKSKLCYEHDKHQVQVDAVCVRLDPLWEEQNGVCGNKTSHANDQSNICYHLERNWLGRNILKCWIISIF